MNKTEKIVIGLITLGLFLTAMMVMNLGPLKVSVSQPLGSSTDNRFTNIPTNTSFVCGPTSNLAVATSSSRQYVALVNDGTSVVYLGLGTTAVTSKGLRLNASGGSYEMDTTHLYTGGIYCISAASSTLTVISSDL